MKNALWHGIVWGLAGRNIMYHHVLSQAATPDIHPVHRDSFEARARCHAMVSIPPLPHGAWPDLAPELVASERHEGIQCRAKVTEEDSE